MSKFFKDNWKYIITILSIILVAGLGTLFVQLGLDWFGSLQKPTNFVPSFIIPIVWTIIYTGYAIFLCVWKAKEVYLIKQ